MIKTILSLIFFVLIFIESFATWSIILIDPKTNTIGIAGASCSDSCQGIDEIIPDMDAIIVQAMSNGDARKMGWE